MESIDFINTEHYSLMQLFSNPNTKIIIPDLQRDYCWGDEIHGDGDKKIDIVTGFLNTLIQEFKESFSTKEDTFLGKIDVYQNPKGHIYLTDGQQRLTTLYLLIGMLYRETKDDTYKQCLVSSEVIEKNGQPQLQYSIRESSLFFMRDLVNEFFINNHNTKVSDIIKQDWFFNEYYLDPTINSMRNTMKIIETKIQSTKNFDWKLFASYLANRVKIQYYDVVDRKHGEERFVIINTTGKSLSITENVKPILLGKITNKQYAQQWEERETWFWKKRNAQLENVADDGVNDFLRWYFQITTQQESVDIVRLSRMLFNSNAADIEKNLKLIDSYFLAILKLLELLQEDMLQTQFKFINGGHEVKTMTALRSLNQERKLSRGNNILLPLLCFIVNISDRKEDVYLFLRRLRKIISIYYGQTERSNIVIGVTL